MKVRFLVILNGTDENSFERFGLNQNPFPQPLRPVVSTPETRDLAIEASSKYAQSLLHLQQLAAEPVLSETQIRDHLRGWSKEFVDLCCVKYRRGQVVKFIVEMEV